VSRNTLLIDAGIAAALAILILVIAPGLAVVGLLALLVVIVCAISFVLDLRRRRSDRLSPRRLAREREPSPPRRRSSRR
jgi:ABC-type bacteriocin/lantibiotic exporter with double-glycine peptidase domain